MKGTVLRTVRVLIVMSAFSLVASPESHATPLYLSSPSGSPDLMTSFASVSYTTSNNLFQAIGSTTDYENGTTGLVDAGTSTLAATITGAGLLTSGSLTLQGDIGSGVETLLTGTLTTGPGGTAFGYTNVTGVVGSGDIFEFLFTVTGGNAVIVSDFGGLGANGGVIVDANFPNADTFDGSWTKDFLNNNEGVSDTFSMIPEPSSVLLVLFGGVLCAVAYRATAAARAVETRL